MTFCSRCGGPETAGLACPECGHRSPHIVLVCGGRKYADKLRVWDVLDEHHARERIALLVHGDADGADRLAHGWAKYRGVQPAACEALWDYHRRLDRVWAAGCVRNRAMLQLRPEVVIAFPGGSGTADMVRQARQAGIRVVEVPRG